MNWSEIRTLHPDQWAVVEAVEAHTTEDSKRHLDQLMVVALCQDGQDALTRYHEFHRNYPEREFYFVHTGRAELEIFERQWLGFRVNHAAQIQE